MRFLMFQLISGLSSLAKEGGRVIFESIEGGEETPFPSSPPALPPPASEGASCRDRFVMEEVRLTNIARQAAGFSELTCSDGLTRAAYLHSQDMCTHGYFAHTSTDGLCLRVRIRAQGILFRIVGENIARGQTTPDAVHATWMESPRHRANILDGRYHHIGVGYVPCGRQPLWTQDFTD